MMGSQTTIASPLLARSFARGFGHGTTVRPKKGRVREKKDEVGRGGGEEPKAPANMAN